MAIERPGLTEFVDKGSARHVRRLKAPWHINRPFNSVDSSLLKKRVSGLKQDFIGDKRDTCSNHQLPIGQFVDNPNKSAQAQFKLCMGAER
jgi:hypothetical protein